MSKHTTLFVLVVLFLMAAILTGCSQPQVIEKEVVVTQVVETEKIVKETVEVVVTPTPEPAAEGGVKVVNFITQETDSDSVAVYQDIIKEFEELNPDVQVDLVVSSNPDHMGQRMVAAASVGADLGIVAINTVEFSDFVEAGLLYPLDEVVDRIGRDTFLPGALVYGPDGKVYAMAYNGGAYTNLWVRTDLLEEAGLEIPTTYEEILAAAEALTQDTDGDGQIDVYGVALPAAANAMTGYVLMGMMYENCADYFDREGNLVFDNPNTLEAIKKYAELLQYAPPAAAEWAWGDVINAMISGKTAMGWYAGRLGWNAYKADPELRDKLKVIHFDSGPADSGFAAYDYLEVYSGVKNPEETMDFLEYMMTGDRMTRFLLTVPGHLLPVTNDVDLLASDNEYVQRYSDDVAHLVNEMAKGASATVQMGFVDPESCEMNWDLNPMPWGSAVFGADNVGGEIMNRIFVGGESSEDAWQWGVERLIEIADEWKADHPDWQPSGG